jgi:hypothetical protein
MSKPKLAIVIGSIRPNRFGGHAAQWIEEIARRPADARSAGMVDRRPQSSAREEFAPGGLIGGSP